MLHCKQAENLKSCDIKTLKSLVHDGKDGDDGVVMVGGGSDGRGRRSW